MASELNLQDIQNILSLARIDGFNGHYEALGGGEVNNTYKLDFEDKPIILRIAKDEGQKTLENEAIALSLFTSPYVPRLIFFRNNQPYNNRLWILESYVCGSTPDRLNLDQFNNLGKLLAQVHKITNAKQKVDLKKQFLKSCRHFGDKEYLLNHPDDTLRHLIHEAFKEFDKLQPDYDHITASLVHRDATPSNLLVINNEVNLIDWEFSEYNDPLTDFSTIYYEDVEYNQGKWRIKIQPEEKEALFSGYAEGGGVIDEHRIRFWIKLDKLGASIFLYWRINISNRESSQDKLEQYKLDLNNLISSLNS